MLSFISFALALFIDGATDCANSVTGAVSCRALTRRRAAFLSAVWGFIGMVSFSLFFPAVAENSALIADFPSGRGECAVIASLLSVFVWSGIAWLMGIPTSEGHGLLAAMAGSALALGGKVSVSDIIAIILWSIPAIFLGAFASYIFVRLFSSERERAGGRIFVIMCSALSSFFHGAQDGQKFLALAVCTNTMLLGSPIATVLLLGFFMALGTYFGGGRIIEKMEDVAPDGTGPALVSDLSGSLTLLILTLLGAPVSTTQVRSAALAAARLGEGKGVKRGDICLLLFAWAATLPVCFSLGFLISKLIFVIIL